MNLIQQHPRDLRLALFEGVPNFPMTVLKEAQESYSQWAFRFCIIGESHAVTVYHAGQPIFSEALACYPVRPDQCVQLCTFDDLRGQWAAHDRYCGQVTFDRPLLNDTEHKDTNAIEVEFPSTFKEVPVTQIQWKANKGVMYWWTLHTYPLVTGTIRVYTQSSFDFASN
jgi:hypothetical protein